VALVPAPTTTLTYGRVHAAPVYKRGRPRTRPWPYHATLDRVGLVLGSTRKNGAPSVTAQKPEDQANVAPTDYGENAQNPIFGRTQTWRTFHLGMGLQVEDEDPSRPEGRYRWAINADCSVASRIAMQGPQLSKLTPGSRNSTWGVTKFFDLGGKLYFLNGEYLQRLDSDSSVTTVGTFGANRWAVDVVVFSSNAFADTVPAYAYIAVLDTTNFYPGTEAAAGEGASHPIVPGVSQLPTEPITLGPNPPDQEGNYRDVPMWRFDGTTLTQHANLTARNFCVIGRDLYRANGRNQVSTVDVDTDPWDAGNWRAENQYLIGDRTASITALTPTALGTLVVFKQDGIYSVDAAGESVHYFSFLKYAPRAGNGANWGAFMNDLYVRYGESLYKLDPDFTLAEVGPNRYGTLGNPVKGRTTAFAGHANFHAYTGMWDPDTDTAYLMKYGSHQPNERGEPVRVEAWHGSIITPIAANRVTALFASTYLAPNDHTRMYLGLRDGSIGWFVLPCTPDPASCTQYRFSVEGSWVVFPNWHAGFPGDVKPLRYAAVSGDNLNGANYVTARYRLDPVSADAASGMPWIDLAGHFDTVPSERIDFPGGTACKTGAFRLDLTCVDPAKSPLVSSFSVRWRLTTDLQQTFDLIVLAEDGLVCRDGTPLRRGAQRIRDHVRQFAESGEIVELVLPDEEIKMVSVYDYGETMGWWERAEKWVSALRVSFAEDSAGAVYGTYGRLRAYTYGNLRGLTYGALRQL